MPLVRRFRLPAIFCAFALLVCELISRPYAEMGISDDAPYILMARTLAFTGHIAYTGWATAMLGWQLYLGAAFIKLFGFSYTSVRMSTLLVSLAIAVLLQRIFVRAGITERNAVLATLAISLSPLNLLLSVTYMSDIFGLFATIICLYGCLRALQATAANACISWLFFAAATNAFFGTARQIAWLGILVMLPCTLWLLRAQRRVLVAGSAATLAGALFIFGCMQWFKHQPYSVPEKIFAPTFPIFGTFFSLACFILAIPFLLLPIVAIFLPALRNCRTKILAAFAVLLAGYLFLAIYPSHLRGYFPLEPTMSGGGNWIGVHGTHEGHHLNGPAPLFLSVPVQAIITIVCFAGLFAIVISLRSRSARRSSTPSQPANQLSWYQLTLLLVPYVAAYILLLIPRAGTGWIYDRYTLEVGVVAIIFLVRYYQEKFRPQVSRVGIALIIVMAITGVTITHNHFALYRARVVLAKELIAAGIPETSVDNGFEYNFAVEVRTTGHINESKVVFPANAAIPEPPLPPTTCKMFWHIMTPHITPLYGISFDPNACYGPAPFPPAQYSRWLAHSPGTLYVIRYTPVTKP